MWLGHVFKAGMFLFGLCTGLSEHHLISNDSSASWVTTLFIGSRFKLQYAPTTLIPAPGAHPQSNPALSLAPGPALLLECVAVHSKVEPLRALRHI